MKVRKVLAVLVVFTLALTTIWANGSNERGAAQSSGGPLELSMTSRLLDPIPDMNNAYWKAYQEKANVKLNVEWIPDSDYTTKLNLKFASNDLSEVTTANLTTNPNNPSFLNAVKNGAFHDLTDILGDFSKYPNLKANVAPDAWIYSRVFGRNYGVPRNQNRVQGTIMMRTDLVEAVGQKMPATTKELLDVTEKIVKQNPGMLGIVSKQDLFLGESSGLSAAFGAVVPEYDSEGGLIHTKLNHGFTKFVAYLREAYARNLLSKEFSAMKANTATEHFQSGTAVVFLNESARWVYPFTMTLKEKTGNSQAAVNFVTPLEGEKGFYAVNLSPGIQDSFFINKKVPMEKVTQILDYFERTTSDDYYVLINYGVEGIHWNYNNKSEMVTTPQREKDMGSSSPWQVLPMKYNPYQKIDHPTAPQAFNTAQRKKYDEVGYETKGIMDPMKVITSTTWAQIWPRHQSTWATKCVQAVVGEISMAEFQSYVDSVNSDPQMKQAYKEFAAEYKVLMGK
jgi:putative aldouronate transport system substrate-binding protein